MMVASVMSRLPFLCTLLLLLLLGSAALSASSPSNGAMVHSASTALPYSPLDGCSIHDDWNGTVEGRSDVSLFAILPAPYCQFVSFAHDIKYNDVIYALDVRTGKQVWQFACGNQTDGNRCDPWLDIHGAALRSTTTLGRLYLAISNRVTSGQCDTMYALDAGTGKVLYSDTVCNHNDTRGNPPPAVFIFPLDRLAGKDEYVLHMVSAGPTAGDEAIVHVLAGSDGRLVWSGNISSVAWNGALSSNGPLPLNNGLDGLFTLCDLTSLGCEVLNVYRVNDDGSVELVVADPDAFNGIDDEIRLYAQPALVYNGPDATLSAIDVLTGATVWNSSDPFLVGDNWGVNASFRHLTTDWNAPTSCPGLFLVVNSAYGKVNNSSVVITQLAQYNLSTGLQHSISPLFTLINLTESAYNPSTWDLVDDDVLAVRADSQWYMLDLPSLTVRAHGHYALADQGFVSKEWLVDADGSYIAVPYESSSVVQGYAPRQDSHAAETFLVSPPDAPTGSSGTELSTTTLVMLVFAALILLVSVIVGVTMLWSCRNDAAVKAANQERLLTVGAQLA